MEERLGPSTIVDVAKAAGVSVATVSRALRGLDRVSPDTREKVRRVAEELHYVASPTATSLASGRTRIVGVIVPFVSRWYFAAMVSGIGKSLRELGYQVLLFDLEQEVLDSRLSLTRSMLWKRVDGVISINIPMAAKEMELLSRLHVPVISIGVQLPGLPSVYVDDALAAGWATQHLIDLGHRDIAYVGAPLPEAVLTLTPRARLAAFVSTIEAAGLTYRDGWVLTCDWSAENAKEAAAGLFRLPGRLPTAVVCASDEIAFGVALAARDAGLAVPAAISIVGIDDHPLARVFDLTTVQQDVAEQAQRAVELLLDRLSGTLEAEPDPGLAAYASPIRLIERGSTAKTEGTAALSL